MRIRLKTLVLTCRRSREVITLDHQVVFIHGGIGSGKSSIARLIDYCLGSSDLERTSAISKELVSVELTAQIENKIVIFDRGAKDYTHVRVTWQGDKGEQGNVLAPLKGGESPIWGTELFNFSDLVFYLFGITPIRVKRSKSDPESPMIRLSIRDMMFYCYLEQAHLDSSFFRLDEPIVLAKSRDVLRYVVGYYSDALQELETKLEATINSRNTKIATSEQMRGFLLQFGYGTGADINAALESVERELEGTKQQQTQARDDFKQKTHFADQLRDQLRAISELLGQEEQAQIDQRERLSEYQSLRAELITAKFKTEKVQAASTILEGVVFDSCPSCGNKIQPLPPGTTETCPLCHQRTVQESSEMNEAVKKDLEFRLEELADTIERTKKAIRRQVVKVEQLKTDKQKMDVRLEEEIRNYDSAYVAGTREIDRKIATLEERRKNLDKTKQLPETIEQLLREADQLRADEESIKRDMQSQRALLTGADIVIKELERAFLESLIAVGVPGMSSDDKVVIDRKSWIPYVREHGIEEQTWTFSSIGSGGKKTLFNVCYALAVHKVAVERNRPLPTCLIIDTPMKNIGEDVNRDVFFAFYKHLYDLARGTLRGTQIIIIDKEYIPPKPKDIDLAERYMTPDQNEHPPLITYYRGP